MKHSHLLGEKPAVEQENLKAIWTEVAVLPELDRKQVAIQLIQQSIQGALREPVTSVLTVLTVSFVMMLLGGFLLFVFNSGSLVSRSGDPLVMSIFLKEGLDNGIIDKFKKQLEGYTGVRSVTFISKDEALERFRLMMGDDSQLVSGIQEKNPLPKSLEVEFVENTVSEEMVLRVKNDFSLSPHVEVVKSNDEAFSRVASLVRTLRLLSWIGTIIMLGIAGLLISNTIRLGIYAHRSEIEIMELVGATDSFIRFPFIIEGAITGCVGTVIGLLSLSFVFRPLASLYNESPLRQFMGQEITFLPVWLILCVLLFGTAVGVVSSWGAARRFSRILFEAPS